MHTPAPQRAHFDRSQISSIRVLQVARFWLWRRPHHHSHTKQVFRASSDAKSLPQPVWSFKATDLMSLLAL